MFVQKFVRAGCFVATAAVLAACSAGSPGVPNAPDPSGASLGVARSTLPGLAPQSFAERFVVGATGRGKRPHPFVRGGHVRGVRGHDVACTTITPSADVLSALEEPGATATAAYVIDTPNGTYKKIDYDGSECDIALYIAPTASGVTFNDSTIHDGIRAGLVVDGASSVKVVGNEFYNVGDHTGSEYTPDGVQYGFGLMLVNAGTNETVSNNSVFNYQKDGILAFDGVGLALTQNDVPGAGAVGYIASNGIEMDGVNFTAFSANRVSLNQYTGPIYGAAGYLACGDTLNGNAITKVQQLKKPRNLAVYNDIEFYVSAHSDCS